jgi:MFS superfamily sulfate permease-like transporter
MHEGLQNYMCYSNSVLYARSGGVGKISSLAISFFTIVLFIIGPSIANFLPRCMAGTLLLHMGVDLVLEGVYDCKLTDVFDEFIISLSQRLRIKLTFPSSIWQLRPS